jgi:hypothetical protein
MNCVTETLTKMIESLPEPLQKKLLDEITQLISEALDDSEWETQFQIENKRLIKIAGHVKEQISAGQASPMDFSKL